MFTRALKQTGRQVTFLLEEDLEASDEFKDKILRKSAEQQMELGALPQLIVDEGYRSCLASQIEFILADNRRDSYAAAACFFDAFRIGFIPDIFLPLANALSGMQARAFRSLFLMSVDSPIENFLEKLDISIVRIPGVSEHLLRGRNSIIDQYAITHFKGCPYTLAQINTDLVESIESLKKEIPQEHPCTQYLTDKLREIDEARKTLMEFIEQKNLNQAGIPLVFIICHALKSGKINFAEFGSLIKLTQAFHFIFDVNLALNIYRAIQQQRNVVIFTGSAHTDALDEVISLYHGMPIFKPLRNLTSNFTAPSLKPEDRKFALTHERLDEVFAQITAAFSAPKQQAKLEAPACAMCGKVASTRCSRCKAVFYCSSDCQKADWKNHKLVCKPIK